MLLQPNWYSQWISDTLYQNTNAVRCKRKQDWLIFKYVFGLSLNPYFEILAHFGPCIETNFQLVSQKYLQELYEWYI